LYTLFSTGKLPSRVKDSILAGAGTNTLLVGIISFFNHITHGMLPTVCTLLGVSTLAVTLYDRTYDVRPLLAEGSIPKGEMLKKLLEKNIEIEHKARVMLMGRRDRTKHPAVRLVIQSLFYDTEKHIKILKAIMDELERGGPPPSREQTRAALEEARQGIEDHIWVEQHMMEALRIVIEASDSAIIKMLLNQMLEEERGHHNILQKIHRFNVETI